jgi:hypothetical protein
MFSCEAGHVFAERELSMPTNSDRHDHTSGRCPVCESRDVFEVDDLDIVNSLLQKDERISVEVMR